MSFKRAVQSSFSRAAGSYNDFSEIQQSAADDLVRLLLKALTKQAIPLDKEFNILDIGCGPGVLETRLQNVLPNIRYVGIDISHAMTWEAKKTSFSFNPAFITTDMDFLPFQSNSFDLVMSSSTLQWSTPNRFPWMQEVHRVLCDKGTFCFNLMVEGSLENFYLAYQSAFDTSFLLHRYPNETLLKKELKEIFQDCFFKEKEYRKDYQSLITFLRDIQKTGARTAIASEQGRLTKRKIMEIERILRKIEGKIQIDYHFCFATGNKIKRNND